MKVVKDGPDGNPMDWKEAVLCGKKDEYDKAGCSATLEITIQDLIMMYWKAAFSRKYYPAVKCPQCGKYNRVKAPDTVRHKFNTADNIKNAIFDGFSDEA